MKVLAWLALGAGIWLLDSAVKNKPPLTTLRGVLAGTATSGTASAPSETPASVQSVITGPWGSGANPTGNSNGLLGPGLVIAPLGTQPNYPSQRGRAF
jgi:hypothetical protein